MIIRRDQAFRVVCNLRTPIAAGESIGTGIFVAKNNTELYLVTATHVANVCNANTSIVMSDANGNATSLQIIAFNDGLSWRHHPIADISALPIRMSAIIQPLLENRFFPFDHFHTDHTSVSRDDELTSIGFPQGLGAHGLFSPLTYRSYASSSFISFNRADTQTPSEFFLLENPSVGGYSGCPVFDLGYMIVGAMTTTKDKTRCYGIMHGTISDDTGGKLAAVTPAFYLAQLI